MQGSKSILYIIPSTLGADSQHTIPKYVKEVIFSLDEFIVENERTARRYFQSLGYPGSLDTLILHPLNKRTEASELESYLNNARSGKNIGLVSDVGCPGIADPGAEIVTLAHKYNIKVVPLVGPSSIFLALMGSGLNGQDFVFRGYLPINKQDRISSIKKLEKTGQNRHQTQIFMETPYRNQHLLNDILQTCNPHTKLCIAMDITLVNEMINTMTVGEWKDNIPDVNKRQVIWLMNA